MHYTTVYPTQKLPNAVPVVCDQTMKKRKIVKDDNNNFTCRNKNSKE